MGLADGRCVGSRVGLGVAPDFVGRLVVGRLVVGRLVGRADGEAATLTHLKVDVRPVQPAKGLKPGLQRHLF